MNIEDIIVLLQQISNTDRYNDRIQKILTFQDLMYLGDIDLQNEKVEEILDNLAYDLEYYQPDIGCREKGIKYLGDEELLEKIKNIIDQINSLK